MDDMKKVFKETINTDAVPHEIPENLIKFDECFHCGKKMTLKTGFICVDNECMCRACFNRFHPNENI